MKKQLQVEHGLKETEEAHKTFELISQAMNEVTAKSSGSICFCSTVDGSKQSNLRIVD